MTEKVKKIKYWLWALDPIHVGSGGYKLGRVDNSIVRDPTTDVPKIPGTSLAGVFKAYLALAKEENTDESLEDIEIDDYFGTESRQGILHFFDAHIVFFPVSSIQGTVWITTKKLLERWIEGSENGEGYKLKIPEDTIDDKAFALRGIDSDKSLNLGWIALQIDSNEDGVELILDEKIKNIVDKIVLVSDKLFSHIVNDNLEVRTSVRIDPKTGTAKSGALFTYEAIPRGTVLSFEIVAYDRVSRESNTRGFLSTVHPYLKLLGIGGLGTRGFGRVDVLKTHTNNDSG